MYNKILSNKIYIESINNINKLEVDRIFCKHGLSHSLDVARIAYIINLENNLGISKNVIYATAILHDIGRSIEGENHNLHSVDLAKKILDECGFSDSDKSDILNAIKNHRKSVDEIKTLADVIKYADKISRNCFDCSAYNKCYWEEERKNKIIKY